MKIKIYAAYGVLGHENYPVYTLVRPATEIFDRLVVEIPDCVPIAENVYGEYLVDLGGRTYLLSEVLWNWGDKPALIWYEGNKRNHIFLKKVATR